MYLGIMSLFAASSASIASSPLSPSSASSTSGITEDDRFDVIAKYFNERGPVYHQFESYEYLVNVLIQKIIDEMPRIQIRNKNTLYKMFFGQVYIEKASVGDEKSHHPVFPHEARLRNLIYESPVSVDVFEEHWEAVDDFAAAAASSSTKAPVESGFKLVNEVVNRKVPLFKLPTMVGSSKCNLYGLSLAERMGHGECLNDPGGYFIINGKERALVCQERINYNQIYVFDTSDEKYLFVSEIRSMSEETNHSVLIQAKINLDNRDTCFLLPYIEKPVRAGAVFKALGFLSGEIYQFISPQGPDEIALTDILIRESVQVRNKREALKYICVTGCQKFEDDLERQLVYTQQVIDNELFPHMGISTPIEKGMLLGSMISKLFKVALQKRPPDDRDNVSLKRIESPALLLSDLFRMAMKRFVNSLKKYLEKRQDAINGILRTSNGITMSLHSCMSTGNWAVQKNSYCKAGVSQLMSRLTFSATLSHLRRVVIPIQKEGKNVKVRQINPSQVFNIDIIESPEGKNIGIVKNLAMLTNITVGANFVLIKEIIESCEELIPSEQYLQSTAVMSLLHTTSVFVNGTLMGFCVDAPAFFRRLKEFHTKKIFNEQVSVVYDPDDNEIRLFCDPGRYIRPVLTVTNNQLCLTAADLDLTWTELIRLGRVRYIDTNEIEASVIAMTPDDLVLHPQTPYDYCELHPSVMLGCCSSIIPYSDHSQSPRLIYETGMFKQALGVPLLTFNQRFDTVMHVMHYPQKPLVNTKYDRMFHYDEMLPGFNPVVAIACYGGYNQEDSVIVNQSSIDRGMSVHTCYKTIQAEENNKTNNSYEKIEVPPANIRPSNSDYSKLGPNGYVTRGIPVFKGDILIGKTSTKIQRQQDPTSLNLVVIEEKHDLSIAVSSGEEGVVDDVWDGLNADGTRMVKVRIRQLRVPEVGDKYSCYSADTEVLTRFGWKHFSQLKPTDPVATLQPDGHLEYHVPLHHFEYDYQGLMYEVDTPTLNVCVTPNHRLYVNPDEDDSFQLLRADAVYRRPCTFLKNAQWTGLPHNDLNFVWLWFVGVLYAHGTAGHSSIHVDVSGGQLADLLPYVGGDIPAHVGVHPNKRTALVEPTIHADLPELKSFCLALPDWVWTLPSSGLVHLLAGMLINQTWLTESSIRVRSRQFADDVQRLVLHFGGAADLVYTPDEPTVVVMIHFVPHNRHQLITATNEPAGERWVGYDGKVHCVEVPGNVIYVRRNGKTCWSGNSRYSQKGVCGLTLRQEDMPYTRDGIVPDLIINPHCMPSRMCVSQLIECLAGKVSSLTGAFIDSTTFSKASRDPVQALSAQLLAHGFQRYGNERMYSGYTGQMLEADIFIGPTYYQRLKHLVSDKVHSRARGDLTVLYRQPLEGRARDGGLRVGEMEQACLLAHGGSALIKENFMTLSDQYAVNVCRRCGNIVSSTNGCRVCKGDLCSVNLPYCAKLLIQELQAMNIKVIINTVSP